MGVNIGPGITIEGGISIVIDDGTPYNTVAPVISVATPNVRVGKTVTSTTGTWNGSYPILGYYYQWLDNSSNIANATASTYVIQLSDLGNNLTSNVIAYSTYGNSSPATSNSLGPVLSAIVTPTIGDFVYGGYYAGQYTGVIDGNNDTYYVIVAPASTEAQATYLTAYAAAEALTTNGYTDWRLPGGDPVSPIGNGGDNIFPTMYSASISGTWPASQAYYVIPSTRYNYWTNVGATLPTPSSSVQTYIFNGTGYDFVAGNNSGVSYRAVRFQTIPT